MNYVPGATWRTAFTTHAANGSPADADATPALTLSRNGVDDDQIAFTVTPAAVGVYQASAVLPADYAAGDVIAIRAAATVQGLAGAAVLHVFVLDARRLADLADFNPAADFVQVAGFTPASLASLFTLDTGLHAGDAVEGSVLGEILVGLDERLAQAADGTELERSQIRRRLGVDGDHDPPHARGDLGDILAIVQIARRA